LRTEKRALTVARTIVANSEHTRDKLIEHFGISADQTHTIYLGVDPHVFRPATHYEKLAARTRLEWPTRKLTAVFAGSLGYDRNKGFDLLFAAWKQLCTSPGWDVDLVAMGDGAEVPHWQSQSEKAGLSGRIRVMGFTQDVAEVFRAADVMVQPSFYEAYGLAAHEALCCGIPALVTRSSGVAERYPFSLSELLLNAPPTVENLVEKLRQWRADWQGHRARVQAFSSRLRERTWADMAHEFIELTMPSLVEPVKAYRGSHAARHL
jgi:glycosyltransferase involved in cell wall biosynthesis